MLEALCSPPPVITTTSTPQSNNSLSSTSGSHHPTSLQQMLHEASASNRSNLAGSTSAFLQKAEGLYSVIGAVVYIMPFNNKSKIILCSAIIMYNKLNLFIYLLLCRTPSRSIIHRYKTKSK